MCFMLSCPLPHRTYTIKFMNVINFDSENLEIDWISFNIEGFTDYKIIADRLSKHFTPYFFIDDKPGNESCALQKKYKVFIRQYTGSKGY